MAACPKTESWARSRPANTMPCGYESPVFRSGPQCFESHYYESHFFELGNENSTSLALACMVLVSANNLNAWRLSCKESRRDSHTLDHEKCRVTLRLKIVKLIFQLFHKDAFVQQRSREWMRLRLILQSVVTQPAAMLHGGEPFNGISETLFVHLDSGNSS